MLRLWDIKVHKRADAHTTCVKIEGCRVPTGIDGLDMLEKFSSKLQTTEKKADDEEIAFDIPSHKEYLKAIFSSLLPNGNAEKFTEDAEDVVVCWLVLSPFPSPASFSLSYPPCPFPFPCTSFLYYAAPEFSTPISTLPVHRMWCFILHALHPCYVRASLET